MGKKQTTVRLDEKLFEDLGEFCRRSRSTQEGVLQAAVFYIVHQMPKEQYLELMQQTSDYIDGITAPSTDESSNEPERITDKVLGEVSKGLKGRAGKGRSAG
jgi:hypothetical protein